MGLPTQLPTLWVGGAPGGGGGGGSTVSNFALVITSNVSAPFVFFL